MRGETFNPENESKNEEPRNLFREALNHELLNAEEENELARRIQSGDKGAVKELVEANLRLVASIAGRYQRKRNFEDLFQEGCVGLIRAAERYQPKSNARFSTYASWWVKRHIFRYLADHQSMVKLPRNSREDVVFQNLNSAEHYLMRKEEHPSDENIAELLGNKASPELVKFLRARSLGDQELEKPVKEDSNLTFKDILIDDEPDDMVEFIDRKRKIGDIRNTSLKAARDDRERSIIESRLLNDSETMEEVAKRYGVSKERIRQIENRLKRRIGRLFEEEGLNKDEEEAV